MNKEEFEKELQKQLDQLPYTKHLDDGQYNDGKIDGFEEGARWAFGLSNVLGINEGLKCDYCDEKFIEEHGKGKFACKSCRESW